MIPKKVEEAINNQIKEEEHSSRIYLAMASWCDANGFPGAASFFYRQTQEERFHALKFIRYVNERGGHAKLQVLPEPNNEYNSIIDLFKETLIHEEFITNCINNVYEVTMNEKDFSTQTWLQFFITEQIEEESTVRGILGKFEMIGDNKSGNYLLDQELAILGAKPVGVLV
ncbi:MAG: ferritin [Bacteroidota bacterium]